MVKSMKNLEKLFTNTEILNPPHELEFSILQKIAIETKKQIKRKLIYSYIEIIGSTLLFIYSASVFGQEILRSEFWSVASLFFSDMGTVLVNWQDFAYSLMESFPIFSTVAILAPIIILLYLLGVNLDLYHQSKHKFVNF